MNVKGQDIDADVQGKFHFFQIKLNCKPLSPWAGRKLELSLLKVSCPFWGCAVVVRFPAMPWFWDIPSVWGGLQSNTTAYTYMIPVHLGNSSSTFQEE